MAEEFRLDAVGLDVSAPNLEKARESCVAHPPLPVEFVCGPAEALPFLDESFDAVVCECAVSTFQDQPRVVAELARVLKPGGVVGISDMIVEGPLPVDVAGPLAPWTCLSGARSAIGYQSLFLAAGVRVTGYADETEALRELVVELKRKLLTAGLARFLGTTLGPAGLDVPELRNLLRRGSALIGEGVIQYARMTFAKGRPRFAPSAAPEECSTATIAVRCDPSAGCC
jgi:SAM-dependent methyltransferase